MGLSEAITRTSLRLISNRLFSDVYSNLSKPKTVQVTPRVPQVPQAKLVPLTSSTGRSRVSDEEVLQYQNEEIAKELTLLEKHLSENCKIHGVACSCCSKHPLTLEALAIETVSISGEKFYQDLAQWIKSIEYKTTEDASASGKYDEEYPKLASQVREWRSKVMTRLPKTTEVKEKPEEEECHTCAASAMTEGLKERIMRLAMKVKLGEMSIDQAKEELKKEAGSL